MSPVSSNSSYINTNLWLRSTEELIRTGKIDLSLSSCFSVDIKSSNIISGYEDVSFLAYEAVLPGTSLELGQVSGDSQGIVEQYPIRRIYPPVDVSFYIQRSYDTLKFFETWIGKISPLNGGSFNPGSYIKFNYPTEYECSINIVKYERDMRSSGQRLTSTGDQGQINDPKSATYTLINAYPSNIISVPVSYDQSNILRTTITFNYDRYVLQDHRGGSTGTAI